MTAITIRELYELTEKNESLREKLLELENKDASPEEIRNLISEYGYEVQKAPVSEMEALSDDDLEDVAGGIAHKQGAKKSNNYFDFFTTLCRKLLG